MTPATIQATYRRMLNLVSTPAEVIIRRYTGTGPNRPHFQVSCLAAPSGYKPEELVGNILQGDTRVILLADDLVRQGFPQPITTNDKAIIDGKEYAIIAVDSKTRNVAGVLIAWELQLRG